MDNSTTIVSPFSDFSKLSQSFSINQKVLFKWLNHKLLIIYANYIQGICEGEHYICNKHIANKHSNIIIYTYDYI